MLNSDPLADEAGVETKEPVASGAMGAIVLAGLATAVVVAIWFAFYFLVFVPRAGAP